MIADIPPRVLTLIRSTDEPAPKLRTNTELKGVSATTMRTLVSEARARGFSTDFIADALDRRIRRYLATVGPRGEGDRNATAYRVARWLLNDFGASEAVGWAYLSEWNATNSPPLTDRELRLTMRSAQRSGSRPAGCAHFPRGGAA